jgi:hypothetical protein
MRFAHLIAIAGLVASFSTGCAKAGKEDCEKMYAKVVEFELEGQSEMVAKMARETLQKQAPKFVEECAGKASKSEVDCVLNAKDKAAYEKCK